MSWKVVVRGDSPSGDSIIALCNLTGLTMSEVQSALLKDGVVAGDGLSRTHAGVMAESLLRDLSLSCSIEPSISTDPLSTTFRVVLTGYRSGSRTRLRKTIQKLSGLPFEQVVVWLSRIPFVLQENVGYKSATAIRKAIVDAGGLVEVQAGKAATSLNITGGEAYVPIPCKHGQHTAETTGSDQEAQSAVLPETVSTEPDSVPEPHSPTFSESSLPDVVLSKAEEPPVIPGSDCPVEAPPVIRFTEPGWTPVIPRVIGEETAESLKAPIEILFCDPSYVHLVIPKIPHDTVKLFLCEQSSGRNREAVVDALMQICDFSRRTSYRLADSCPSWIASFSDSRMASYLASDLESVGVTVMLAKNMPERPNGENTVTAPPLLEWLSPQ